jgi:hypothetical protein
VESKLEKVVMIRCIKCRTLNEEDAQYCKAIKAESMEIRRKPVINRNRKQGVSK